MIKDSITLVVSEAEILKGYLVRSNCTEWCWHLLDEL